MLSSNAAASVGVVVGVALTGNTARRLAPPPVVLDLVVVLVPRLVAGYLKTTPTVSTAGAAGTGWITRPVAALTSAADTYPPPPTMIPAADR